MDIAAARHYFYERERQRQARREAERGQWLQQVRTAILHLAVQYPEVQSIQFLMIRGK